MNRAVLPALLALVVTACSSLPAIPPMEPAAGRDHAFCQEVFPGRAWSMVHSIQTEWPGGRRGVMMGVVSLQPDENTVHCALLSIEGLRLFEARDDGTLTVHRALPPFDRPALAAGMMADIRLLFFPPAVSPSATGRLTSGEPVCRYELSDGYEDIVRAPSGPIVLLRYDDRGRLTRRATVTRCRPEGAADLESVACRIHLEAFRPTDYRLDLELIEARPVLDKQVDGP